MRRLTRSRIPWTPILEIHDLPEMPAPFPSAGGVLRSGYESMLVVRIDGIDVCRQAVLQAFLDCGTSRMLDVRYLISDTGDNQTLYMQLGFMTAEGLIQSVCVDDTFYIYLTELGIRKAKDYDQLVLERLSDDLMGGVSAS